LSAKTVHNMTEFHLYGEISALTNLARTPEDEAIHQILRLVICNAMIRV